ncbi:MAG: DHH family phosphoesterase [Elusimicrobia bacterium]|nr:DHH family phosphoesterase [Elusimicrobiota bacterium]
MEFGEFLKNESERTGIDKLAEKIKKFSGKTALIYTHDDPDGLSAGVILKRALEKFSYKVIVKVPTTMELERERLTKDARELKPDIVFVVDKATMGYYDDYAEIHPEIVVIDHHPLLGNPLKKITVVNPVLDGYKRCSASFVVYLLSEFLGVASTGDEIAALIGLKGDWAVEPATDDISDYVASFYEKTKEKNFWLVEKISSRPTMFEVKQREKTTLLNQVAEIIFALGGGGFQYFYYDRDKDLADVRDGFFAFENLEFWISCAKQFLAESEFLENLKAPHKAKKIFDFYLNDWNKTMTFMENSTPAKFAKETDIYIFLGHDVKLMPMAGSVVLYQLPQTGQDVLFIMISQMDERGVHFSFRSRNGKIHCGDFAHNLALRLQKRFGDSGITGGGHPFAAECRTRSRRDFSEVMIEFFSALSEV